VHFLEEGYMQPINYKPINDRPSAFVNFISGVINHSEQERKDVARSVADLKADHGFQNVLSLMRKKAVSATALEFFYRKGKFRRVFK
jgi:hypothetical protein